MIYVGAKVWFCPYFAISGIDTPEERKSKRITGIISFVNWKHHVFTVQYESGGTTQLESFKFCDIGQAVKVIG